MREGFLEINGVSTRIITWVAWVKDDISKFQEVVLCIPGNPGIAGFYKLFLTELHNQIGKNIPIWIIGFAGHDEPPENVRSKVPPLKGNETLYNLAGQIEHKKQFIRQYVPETTKIHLIGHSIGSHIILNILDDPEIKRRVKSNYLLFPVIEKVAETKNGKYFFDVWLPRLRFYEFLLFLFNILPEQVKYGALYIYCLVFNLPKEFIQTVIIYFRKSVSEKVCFLGIDNGTVKHLNVSQVENNLPITKYYYGPNDQWAPEEFFLHLIERFPGVNAELCSRNIEHAFVLRSSKEMGNLVASWILGTKCKDI